ncbi:MAG: nitrate ABC transporter ATP-binding protein [Cyanobium sp.]
MQPYLTVDHITQTFPLEGGGQYVALKDIDLTIREGEFVSLIGHSGCGKSTLLNLMAGLTQASSGGILIKGRQVVEPGPDRMVVFQNYSLLPWQSVRQNVALAVNRVLRDLSAAERRERVEASLRLVGLSQAADRLPAELSGGMKQRVAIARALSIRPSLLLLDEPFGALDALTRGNLQQQLMQICQESGVTAVMVTHDVDEALLLSDRVVCLTNGPEARIGQILPVPFQRPRNRLEVMDQPGYYELRSELIGFLQQQRRLRQRRLELERQAEASRQAEVQARSRQPVQGPVCRVPSLVRVGYMPGLDVAPLAMALDQGLFNPEALRVAPISYATWERLELALREGQVDVAITPASTPLRLSLGLDGRSPWPAITPMTVSRNGNALCIARHLGDLGVEDPASLREWLQGRDRPFSVAVPQRQGMSELLLRHWLAGAGIDPETLVRFVTMSPMAMPASLRTEQVDAFIAGRYRVAEAVQEGLALVLATDRQIWQDHPEKVLTCQETWAATHQEALIALCAGLMRAAERCDDSDQRQAMVQVLSQPQWLGRRASSALSRQFRLRPEEETARMRFNHFHVDRAHVSHPAEGCWILSQLARWSWCPFPSNRVELLSQVYRQDLCERALEQAGFAVLPLPRGNFLLADGLRFDPDDPLAYLRQLPGEPAPPLRPLTIPWGDPQATTGADAAKPPAPSDALPAPTPIQR